MEEHMRGEDIFQYFKNFVAKTQLPVCKLMSITTDGALAMVGRLNGFITKCREDDVFPNFLMCKNAEHEERRLFRAHLEKANCSYSDLLLHTDKRWLSRGKVSRLQEIWLEIRDFLSPSQ